MSQILVIDDDRNLRLLLDQELTDDGYEVSCAEDGPHALEYLKSRRPDAVVLDITMPGMNGIEVLGKILAHDKSIPVILHTAYANYQQNFMTWTANAYVVKSGDLTELRRSLKDILHLAA